MNEYASMKDKTALGELEIIISELNALIAIGKANIGKCRPIFPSSDVAIIKDHLDLVVKYISLY